MEVFKTFKYRIYPTPKQAAQFELTFHTCAFIWNKFLEWTTKAYQRRGERLTVYDCDRLLKEMKEYRPWLKQVDNKAMRNAIRNLFNAREAFFHRLKAGEKPGYPKYKGENNPVRSYTTNAVIHVTGDYIQLPKVKRLKYAQSCPIEGTIVEATVTRSKSGKYYVSICCEVETELLPVLNTAISIKRGAKDFAVDSNGAHYENPKYLEQERKRLRREQRRLTRMKPGSKNRKKQRKKVDGIYAHISNMQSDHHHKLSRKIVNENQVIIIEDVDDARMITDDSYARAINEAAWGKFIRLLQCKSEWAGRELIRVLSI